MKKDFEKGKKRIFAETLSEKDLKWHFDELDRKVEIIECGDGWFFQLDNELPFCLKCGDIFVVKAGVWHRLLNRGAVSPLVAEIEE